MVGEIFERGASKSSQSERGAKNTPTKSQEKSTRSLNKLLAEHREKLKAYKENPDAIDNKGF